jgi:hypothetical protein
VTKHSQKVVPQKKRIPIWLPLIVVAGLALIVVVIAGSNNAASVKPTLEVSGAPALKVDKEKVDLGDVRLGQTVQVSFDVTNVGDRILRFTDKPYVQVVEGC